MHARGYVIALISAMFLSLTGPLIRHLTADYDMPALVLAFWRQLLVTVTLIVALMLVRRHWLRVERRHLPYLLGYGAVLAIFNSLWALSVSLNGASVATVLVFSSAAFTAVLGWWWLDERLDWAKLTAVGLALLGCALVSDALNPTAWDTNLGGILTGISAGLCFAIYSLMGRSATQRGLNTWTTLLYAFGFAGCFLLTANLLPGQWAGTAARPADIFWLGDAWGGWLALIILAAVPTVAGYGLYNLSMVWLPSSITNLIVTSEPAFTAIIAYFFLHERLSATQVVGSLILLSGVIFLRVYEGWWVTRPKARRHTAPASAG